MDKIRGQQVKRRTCNWSNRRIYQTEISWLGHLLRMENTAQVKGDQTAAKNAEGMTENNMEWHSKKILKERGKSWQDTKKMAQNWKE